MTPDDALVPTGEHEVRQLLREQHPDLAGLPLTHAGQGMDNDVWRLGDALCVRLPRHENSATLLVKELAWLPQIAPLITLPYPTIERRGEASEQYPHPWSIVRWLEGTPANEGDLPDGESTLRVMGTFVRALHQVAPENAPRNIWRGVPLASREATIDERREKLNPSLARDVTELWERVRHVPDWAGRVWIHGDLHPGNILVRDGVVSGVLDFDDLCQGDPATDLAGVLMMLPLALWPEFLTSYGSSDPFMTKRTIGWALLFGVIFATGPFEDRAHFSELGHLALANVLRFAAEEDAN